MSAGERIRIARKRRGWTQKDLASHVGCSQQTIVDIESQEVPLSRFLSRIISELGESLEWIERGLGSPAGSVVDANRLPHLDLETVALRSLDPAIVDQEIDSLYSSPVEMSRMAFTVGVDRMTAQVMADSVREDDVLFIDPGAEPFPGRLVLALMPGWQRAELRILESSAGRHFLGADSDRFGDSLIPCRLFRVRDEYLSSGDSDPAPALIVGTVVFIGHDV